MAWLADRISTKTGSTVDLFRLLTGGKMTATGKTINVANAIEVATVFACCRVIGEGVAQVPLKIMRESADGASLGSGGFTARHRCRVCNRSPVGPVQHAGPAGGAPTRAGDPRGASGCNGQPPRAQKVSPPSVAGDPLMLNSPS